MKTTLIRTRIIRDGKKWRLAGAAAAFVLLLALAGGTLALTVASGAPSPQAPPTMTTGPSPPLAYVPTTEGTADASPESPSSAVAQALSAMADTDIVSASTGRPPADVPTRNPPPAVPGLYVTVSVPDLQNADAMEPLWEADLLEGAVVEEAGSSSSLARDIGYVQIDADLPDGKTIPNAGGAQGNIARGQVFAGATDSDSQVATAVADVATTYGLTVTSLKIFHELGDAPALVLTTPNFAAVAPQYNSLVNSLFGSSPRYQAWYLEIRGSDGTPDLRSSASFVTGTSRFWVNPSVDGASDFPVQTTP